MSSAPLELAVLTKALAHWITTSLPLVIATPLLGLFLNLDSTAIGAVALTLLAGTPALTCIGLIGAVHIVADKASRAALPPAAGIGALIQQSAMDRGVLLRAAPDAVYVCPPLIVTRAEIDELMDALSAALDDGYAEAMRRGLVGGVVKAAV